MTGVAVAYGCAKVRSRRLGAALAGLFALGLILPVQSGVVPLFLEMQKLHLYGTLLPMILINAALQMPLTVLLLTASIKGIPQEIEDAALVDGAGPLRSLVSIVVPLARPAIVTSVILALVTVWNDYFIALVFASSPSLQTLPLGLANFHQQYTTDWPASLAYSAMIALPVLVIYLLLQRKITDGIVAGAVK